MERVGEEEGVEEAAVVGGSGVWFMARAPFTRRRRSPSHEPLRKSHADPDRDRDLDRHQ